MLSPGDDPLDIASKVAVYLHGGSALVVVVDPTSRVMLLHDRSATRTFSSADTVRHDALPEFELDLGPFFSSALDLPA